MEHYKYPLNKGTIENASIYRKELNPSCGDVVELYLLIEDGKIKDIKWEGQGCSISQASMSLLSENIKDMDIEKITTLDQKYIEEMLEISISHRRIMCADLSLLTLKNAINKYQNQPIIGFNELLEI